MATLPIADVPLDHGPGAEIVRLSARLTCRSAGLRGARRRCSGWSARRCRPVRSRALRAELDARVAHLYGLSADQLELILADFRQSADAEGSPVRPDDAYKQLVRQEFARLAHAPLARLNVPRLSLAVASLISGDRRAAARDGPRHGGRRRDTRTGKGRADEPVGAGRPAAGGLPALHLDHLPDR